MKSEKLVLVSGISKQKAQELLKGSRHDVANFRPDMLQKVLDNGGNDEICGLFDVADKRNALVLMALMHGYGPGTYVHELVGFRRGYGEKALAAVEAAYGPIWLMASPKETGSQVGPKFGLNVGLLDGFYRKISWLKEWQLSDSIWHCPVSFFCSDSISKRQLMAFCQAEYGQQA